jgi:hypothetical protein
LMPHLQKEDLIMSSTADWLRERSRRRDQEEYRQRCWFR